MISAAARNRNIATSPAGRVELGCCAKIGLPMPSTPAPTAAAPSPFFKKERRFAALDILFGSFVI
jgi:hypothetical protein